MVNNLKHKGLLSLYLLGFLFAFHTALPAFISSTFLNLYVSEKNIGLVYLLAYIFTILCFILMPAVLRKFGNYQTALFLMLVDLVALAGLVFIDSTFWSVIFFIINSIVIPLLYFSYDIFLEGYSNNKQTGVVRGIYLTSINLAWMMSPFIAGLILTNGDYWKIYICSLFIILVMFSILIFKLKNFKDTKYEVTPIWKTINEIQANKNLASIVSANFLLYFFYSWMVIYVPLYLYKYIGFSWVELGVIFSIMLLPFVLFQYPLGRLADRRFGEKEILSLGFIIAAVSTFFVFFVTTKDLVLWAIILFMTRVGASTIEVMCDTYFFKKVDSLNTNVISFYRMSGSFAYIFGTFFATIVMSVSFLGIKSLFLILGLVMLLGLRFSLSLKDTK